MSGSSVWGRRVPTRGVDRVSTPSDGPAYITSRHPEGRQWDCRRRSRQNRNCPGVVQTPVFSSEGNKPSVQSRCALDSLGHSRRRTARSEDSCGRVVSSPGEGVGESNQCYGVQFRRLLSLVSFVRRRSAVVRPSLVGRTRGREGGPSRRHCATGRSRGDTTGPLSPLPRGRTVFAAVWGTVHSGLFLVFIKEET